MSVSSELPVTSKMLLLFKSDLCEQQNELTRTIDRTHKDIRALADSERGDVIDESCGNATKEVMFTNYTESRKQLHKIEAALERIDSGEFGICAVCGGPIGLKRLQALPWANNCIECQEQCEQGRVQ